MQITPENFKKSSAFIILTFFSFFLIGQQQTVQRLTTSGIEHTSTIRGVLKYAFDGEDGIRENGESYLFNNGFTTSVQMGGYDEEDNLGVCANYYFIGNNTDFHSGILEEISGIPIAESSEFYNKIWKIHDFEIIALKEKHNNGDLTVEDLTEDIKTWPAKGNPYVNSVFVVNEVAPFFDSDFDGIYNPLMGDYPVVSSKEGVFVPSQFTFNVYHDQGFHGVTNAEPMKMQFFQTQYVINCTDGDLERTVFTILKTVSYNSSVWKNSYLGLYIDHDLGCHTRDRFGFDAETNSVYTYNQGGYDDSLCDYEDPVHSSRSAVKSIVFSEPIHTLSSVIPNIDQVTNTGVEVYNRLSGLFSDGTPITFGGDGYNSGSQDTIKHLYPDFPNDSIGWSLESTNAEDSRYGFFTSVSLGNISPGETNQIEFAELVMVSETEEGLDIFNSYKNRVSDMKEAQIKYINDETLCTKVQICDEDCVWPGDANNNGKVDNDDYIYIAAALNTENAASRTLIDTDWYPHNSNDWGTNEAMVDFKHSDANGNGKINSWDTRIVKENYGLQNDSYEEAETPAFIGDPNGLYFKDLKDEYSTSGFDSSVRPKMYIGDDYNLLSDSIIGISYDLTWDTSFMDIKEIHSTLGWGAFYNNEVSFDIPGEDYIIFLGDERINNIYAAYFNLSSKNILEGGYLSNIEWRVKGNATTINTNGRDTVNLIFSNILALNAIGEKVEVGLREQYSVIITDLEVVEPVAVNDLVSNSLLTVFPNPTSNILNYECKGCANITKVSLVSIRGKLVEKNPTKIHSIDVSGLPMGLYILKIETEQKVYTKKVLVE